jgi:hypothetical protein
MRRRSTRRSTRIVQLALAGLLVAGMATPSSAGTGTVTVVFTKAGLVVGVGGGRGVLTYHGERYPFRVSGASFGATIGASTTKFVGTALNLRAPHDITGTYSALGVGAALAGGAGQIALRNASGVVLHLTGAKVGVELSASVAGITITMD